MTDAAPVISTDIVPTVAVEMAPTPATGTAPTMEADSVPAEAAETAPATAPEIAAVPAPAITTEALEVEGGSVAVAEAVVPRLPDSIPTASRVEFGGVEGAGRHGIGTEDAEHEFVSPSLISYGPATTVMAIGRLLLVVAVLLIGFAARRTVDRPDATDAFWSVALAAGVATIAGVAAIAYWCVQFAENGRRLSARVSAPDAAGWTWAIPLVWVALATLTFLHAETDADIDPSGVLALVGLAIALAIPVSRLQKTFRGMTRRPPNLWLSVYVLDLVAVGAVWWQLMAWSRSSTIVDDDHISNTATIAFAAAGLLAAAGLFYAFVALRAVQSTYERLGRVEARHRSSNDSSPSWFHSGYRPDVVSSVVEQRPLINLAPLSSAVAIGHVVLGALLLGWAAIIARTAAAADSGFALFGVVRVDGADLDRLDTFAFAVVVGAAAVIGLHGIWGFLAGLDASRATVHAGTALSYGAVFAPAPVLVVAGVVAGGTAGEVLIIAGLCVSFVALVRLDLLLIAVSSHLGARTRGFGIWTWLILGAGLVALAQRFVVAPDSGRLGTLALVTALQGVLVIAGGMVGRGAMRSFERAVEQHPQVRRANAVGAVAGG